MSTYYYVRVFDDGDGMQVELTEDGDQDGAMGHDQAEELAQEILRAVERARRS